MRRLIWFGVFLVLLLIQGGIWLVLPDDWSFDVLIPGLYFFALLNGEAAAFLAGLGVGLLQDSLTPGFFGFHMLTRCAIGYLCGSVGERVYSDKYSDHVSLVGLISIGVKLFAGLVMVVSRMDICFLPGFFMDTVIYAIINMLLTVPICCIVKYANKWANPEEQLLNFINSESFDKVKMEYLNQHEGLRYKRERSRE